MGAGARERARTLDDIGYVEVLMESILPSSSKAGGPRADQGAAPTTAASLSSAGPAPTSPADAQSSRRGSGPLPVGGDGPSDGGRVPCPACPASWEDADRLPELAVEEGAGTDGTRPAERHTATWNRRVGSPRLPGSPVEEGGHRGARPGAPVAADGGSTSPADQSASDSPVARLPEPPRSAHDLPEEG